MVQVTVCVWMKWESLILGGKLSCCCIVVGCIVVGCIVVLFDILYFFDIFFFLLFFLPSIYYFLNNYIFYYSKNNQGQLGHGTTIDILTPSKIVALSVRPETIDASGEGDNSNNDNYSNTRENHITFSSSSSTTATSSSNATESLSSHNKNTPAATIQIAGGWEHTLALDARGQLFSFGSGYKDSRRSGLPPVLGHGTF